MIVKHGDHDDFADALEGHYISHTNTSLDFTAGPQVATSVTGLDFTDTSAWHCIVVSLDSAGITYLVDETKNGTGMLSESQATNVSASDVEFGSIATDIGLVIRMPNALTLDQMYTLKRSTQEPFLGSRFSLTPFSFSSGALSVSGSSSGATTFLALSDTPSSFVANQNVAVNGAGNALVLVSPPASGGATANVYTGITNTTTSAVTPTSASPVSLKYKIVYGTASTQPNNEHTIFIYYSAIGGDITRDDIVSVDAFMSVTHQGNWIHFSHTDFSDNVTSRPQCYLKSNGIQLATGNSINSQFHNRPYKVIITYY
jgi:hypothetical protein